MSCVRARLKQRACCGCKGLCKTRSVISEGICLFSAGHPLFLSFCFLLFSRNVSKLLPARELADTLSHITLLNSLSCSNSAKQKQLETEIIVCKYHKALHRLALT